MWSSSVWDGCKKAQTWFVVLVKFLRLPAETGMCCLLQPYSLSSCYFVQPPYYLEMMLGLLQHRWRAADSASTLELALPANTSRRSRLRLYVVPDFHKECRLAAIGTASICMFSMHAVPA
jgi:hypothetical protein